MLAEMDHNVGQMLDAVDRLGVRDNTDRGLRERQRAGVHPPLGRMGRAVARAVLHRARGRHPRAVPDPLAGPGACGPGQRRDRARRRPVPDARPHRRAPLCRTTVPIDGVDQSAFFLGKTDKSAREGILIWCAERLQAVKWRHYKVHFYQQETMVSAPVKLGVPKLFNLYTNPTEDDAKPTVESWIVGPC
jgi:arylsulfatase